MNSVLTRPKTLEGLYKTYFSFANKFQFTNLLKNYVQNETWKDTTQKHIWELLSKISDDIGAVLTDDIVNYTRNVVDVNTCKVPQLIEQGKMLLYGLDHIKNSYDFLPNKIKCLVDIFSINPEYLIGNGNNHILSDDVVREILVYIRDNIKDKSIFSNSDVIDRIIDDPHSLLDANIYRHFVQILFYNSIIDALSTKYSDTDDQYMVFNLLWFERLNQQKVISRIDEYKTWVDRFIWNEVVHPLNRMDNTITEQTSINSGFNEQILPNTIGGNIQSIMNQRRISSKFNPFTIADDIYFNGLNPTSNLSEDELELVEMVLNYHSKPKYDYEKQMFIGDISTKIVDGEDYYTWGSTQYAYYKELEFCSYVKMVMFIVNNLDSFRLIGLTYEPNSNKFIQTSNFENNSLRVAKIFNWDGCVVQLKNGDIALNYDIILKVSKFLCDYVFYLQGIRENMKTIAQKHAMRGSGALLVHIINDYLTKELPFIRDRIFEADDIGNNGKLKFGWELDSQFSNAKIIEYDDDNEYFNIEPFKDVRFTGRTNDRYWEKLEGLADDQSFGVLTKKSIKDFYRNTLGMNRLQPKKNEDYDDIVDFLTDLFKIGANPISYDLNENEFKNPIDDIIGIPDSSYGYDKEERLDVQNNTELRENQEQQFLEYSGNDNIIGNSIYQYVNNRIFYWKNTDYSSHVLHPFMYNLKLWNPLNNIIINGYKDYVNIDLIEYLSSKTKFDEIFGKYGEGKNFWKYNIMDLSGYTTRYESAIKNEHIDDENRTISKLTGYDGLFYPESARDFLDVYESTEDFTLPQGLFYSPESLDGLCKKNDNGDMVWQNDNKFIQMVYSIYWQITSVNGEDTFYTKWYSHLNYTRNEYQKIAIQLWYWRDRIVESIKTNHEITKYCLDIGGNSLILVSTLDKINSSENAYLIDLQISQNMVYDTIDKNRNTHVSSCSEQLHRPSELWIRWKSNPLALPAFDVNYDHRVSDEMFDYFYRTSNFIEMGQLTHSDQSSNQNFRMVIKNWKEIYGQVITENMLPVFFDMEQSANVLALASWYAIPYGDDDTSEKQKYVSACFKNPIHILSHEKLTPNSVEYSLIEYASNDQINRSGSSGWTSLNWIFDAYHYCPANGSLLIPMYRFECEDDDDVKQMLNLNMFVIPAQQLKNDKYTANSKIQHLEMKPIDLNLQQNIYENNVKPRFDGKIKVCRNSNVVFSVSDIEMTNTVRCAFLGQFIDDEYPISFKVGSCDAKTRYEFDSQGVKDLALMKNKYYTGENSLWKDQVDNEWNESIENLDNRHYVNEKIGFKSYNSYDSLDKYVMVIDINADIDDDTIFKNQCDNLTTYSYNILGDAGFIPHFAYQSLIKYADDDGGIAYTWKNSYFKIKNYLKFELLGLDDVDIPIVYDTISRMVVKDTTDGCDTLLNPTKMIQDIYRVWCQSIPGENRYGYFDDSGKWHSGGYGYFPNEYKDYSNPTLKFSENGDTIWNVCEPEDGFELELPMEYVNQSISSEEMDLQQYRNILDEYYVSVVRTKRGEVLNEKRYLLPPTRISNFIFGIGSDDGFIRCNISPYSTSEINGNKFSNATVVFTGTQNPFRYDENGERIYSKPEELQYGNSICGVAGMSLNVEISSVYDYYRKSDFRLEKTDDGTDVIVDDSGNKYDLKLDETNTYVLDKNDQKIIKRQHKMLVPTLKIVKSDEVDEEQWLLSGVKKAAEEIDAGEITIIFSHKNLDNIAKYHILNRSSNLYFNGSLSKSWSNPYKYSDEHEHDPYWLSMNNIGKFGRNEFKYSDFKFSQTVELVEFSDDNGIGWKSKNDDGDTLKFYLSQVKGNRPVKIESSGNMTELDYDSLNDVPPYYILGKDSNPEWFLEQTEIQSQGDAVFKNTEIKKKNKLNDIYLTYDIPSPGNFKYAHKVLSKPQSYLDYLYVQKGSLRFKVNEESYSFTDMLNVVPEFHIDDVMRNKLEDLNDVQILHDYSTFIHQSEDPDRIRDCNQFNPLEIDANVKYGIEQTEVGEDKNFNIITLDGDSGTAIEFDTLNNETKLKLQLDDGEIDDYLKIYTNYVKVDDGNGDFHFDLYFNIQNLFNSPFEYISSVTGQANVLILKDSYLKLSGDKYTDGKIDVEKVKNIKNGGILTIYGQVKTYTNDILSDATTLKLFQYRVYNVSDDKPKFIIDKIYDITKSTLQVPHVERAKIRFNDVLWTMHENLFVGNPSQFEQETNTDVQDLLNKNKFRILNQDVTIIQPVDIYYDWNENNNTRINSISFDIVNDIIDFDTVPEMHDYLSLVRTLRDGDKEPYYDHWGDKYMEIMVDPITNIPRLTLTYDSDCGHNFQRIYLKWKLPRGFRVMESIDRLGGYVFSSKAENITVQTNSDVSTNIDSVSGHIVARVPDKNEMYLGLEHSTNQRLNGYVLTGLSDAFKQALKNAIKESDLTTKING